MVVKITPNDKGNPAGKLADAELHFTDGALEGMKLIGFAIWERRSGGGRNVTFPARQYVVNGDRRSFALLRPITDTHAQERVRDLVLQAYAEYEEIGHGSSFVVRHARTLPSWRRPGSRRTQAGSDSEAIMANMESSGEVRLRAVVRVVRQARPH